MTEVLEAKTGKKQLPPLSSMLFGNVALGFVFDFGACVANDCSLRSKRLSHKGLISYPGGVWECRKRAGYALLAVARRCPG